VAAVHQVQTLFVNQNKYKTTVSLLSKQRHCIEMMFPKAKLALM